MIHLRQSQMAKRQQKKPAAALPLAGKGTNHALPRIDEDTIRERCDCLTHELRILQRLAERSGVLIRIGEQGVSIKEGNPWDN